jgi:hypothetical protein
LGEKKIIWKKKSYIFKVLEIHVSNCQKLKV